MYDIIRRRAADHQGNQMVAALDWSTTAQAAQRACEKLVAYQKDFKASKMPVHFDERFAAFTELEKEANAHMSKVSRYMVSFDEFDAEVQVKNAKEIGAVRDKRDKLSVKIRALSVPAVLTKAVSDFETGLLEVDAGTSPGKSMPAPTPTTVLEEEFGRPRKFAYDEPAQGNKWAEGNVVHFNANKDAIEKETARFANSCVERGVNHSHHTLEPSQVAAWCFGADKFFTPSSDVKPILSIIRTYCLDNRPCIVPLKSQRQVIQCGVGHLMVAVLDAATARGIPDVDAFLADSHYTVLSNVPVFALSPGDSLYVPMGHVALCLAVARDKDGAMVVERKKTEC